MIQTRSRLLSADNSGARLMVCIKVLGSSKIRYANIGSLIKVTIKKCNPKGKVKKGEIYNALIVRTLKGIRRIDGSLIKFDDNSAVLLNNKLEFIGSRIFGAIVRELKSRNFPKILSLASEVL